MPKKDPPLEQNWKHWKELYEMQVRKFEAEKNKWADHMNAQHQHSLTLGRALAAIMDQRAR